MGEEIMRKSLLKILILIFIVVGGFFISRRESFLQNKTERIEILKRVDLLKAFNSNFKKEIVLGKEIDVTGDGQLEGFIIYRDGDRCWLTVAYETESGEIKFSEAIPAPLEGQEIVFNDYDSDGQIEFIISGYKNDKIGYGVFRFSNFKVIDLFAEGMKECC